MAAHRTTLYADERPDCPCGCGPMLSVGVRNGRRRWRCRTRNAENTKRWYDSPKGQARKARVITIKIAGESLYIGLAPTREAAHLLRQKIREEAPRGH